MVELLPCDEGLGGNGKNAGSNNFVDVDSDSEDDRKELVAILARAAELRRKVANNRQKHEARKEEVKIYVKARISKRIEPKINWQKSLLKEFAEEGTQYGTITQPYLRDKVVPYDPLEVRSMNKESRTADTAQAEAVYCKLPNKAPSQMLIANQARLDNIDSTGFSESRLFDPDKLEGWHGRRFRDAPRHPQTQRHLQDSWPSKKLDGGYLRQKSTEETAALAIIWERTIVANACPGAPPSDILAKEAQEDSKQTKTCPPTVRAEMSRISQAHPKLIPQEKWPNGHTSPVLQILRPIAANARSRPQCPVAKQSNPEV